ncbi:MAG: Smr/MutS family protein, partial [Myxococcota bacterium]
DELVRNLETQRRELALARAALSEEKDALATREAVIAKKEESLREKKEKALDAEAAKLRDALRRSREDLRRARRLLKKKPNEQNLDDVRRRIEEAAQTAALRPQQTPEDSGVPVDPSTLRVGARVWVPRLRSFAEILEDPKQGRVRVIAGALRLFVNVADLRKAPEERGRPKLAPAEPKPAAPPSADNTLDVRGLRVDEALGLAESFLDRMYGASETVAYILHGIGTGALRDAIRTRLHEDASYVKSFRAGTRDEGGERLTVVTLK